MMCQMMVNANWMRAMNTGSSSTAKLPQDSRLHHLLAATESEPEDQFFSGVEPASLRVLRADETTAFLQPNDVDLSRNVVLDPKCHDQNEPGDECKADEIVHIFGCFRNAAEGFRAE